MFTSIQDFLLRLFAVFFHLFYYKEVFMRRQVQEETKRWKGGEKNIQKKEKRKTGKILSISEFLENRETKCYTLASEWQVATGQGVPVPTGNPV